MDKKVVLISGGSSGLGLKIAEALSKKDTQVVILSPFKDQMEEAAKTVGCDWVMGDVSDPQSVKQAVNAVISNFTRIDCLINCAGVWIEGELDSNSPEDIAEVIAVNSLGTIYLTRAVVPLMKKQKSGLIINIGSQRGLQGKKNRSVYAASKFAVTGFTQSLQDELSQYGIRVTGVNPGVMNTSMFKKAGIERDLSESLDPGQVAKTVEFIFNLAPSTLITEIGIKQINS